MGEEQELRIATALAGVLNGDDYSTILDVDHEEENQWGGSGSCQLCASESLYPKLSGMTAELAMSRAKETDRDFHAVYEETQHSIRVKVVKILARTVHPALKVLTQVVVSGDDQEDGEHVCGICQDEMKSEDDVRALGCKHSFHCECIFKWLNKKMVCPLCRYSPLTEEDHN
ncbi:E3 ubiquitin-protein ligase RNF181-like [Coffea eugenioides]|uniref:E3 ubiquitin-protein ligase RNF181-like n=1 Tax=Coffea eugenioides TaxID=49369 RepID=UPI000F60F790|nr:E3 ubiquitin-protein ligase RNF181-like [Coffea eugenioides]XP_027182262.1 E3 ubiquitin-protein ligase RNF181-like [Coffea eugenioides]